jgi:hypothetical protein
MTSLANALFRAVALAAALLLTVSQTLAAAPAPAPGSMNQITQTQIYPQLDYLAQKLRAEKMQTAIDGHPGFNGQDKFLPGKVASGLGHIILNAALGDKNMPQYLADFRAAADMTVGLENHTWGVYYYLQTLYELKKAGLLEQAVSPATLATLRKNLDWRIFVTQPDFKLVNLPTNYYGVAFGVARFRMLLGWEDDSGSTKLLAKLLGHYEEHSGKYGFSDETDGEGRFDRYSILLIAEICERFIDTGLTVTPDLKQKLRRATDIALDLGNVQGDGFAFGRSIGVYGDTAILEILSTSAYLDVLNAEEKQYAYAFSIRIFEKYMSFWYDPATHSVDMWGKGRRTDTYRGIHRILGENFSLLHQLISVNDMWRRAGFENAAPKTDLQAWLDKTRQPFSLTWFARADYDRALAIYRDRGHVFSLLMINGGAGQHANSPYYPLPFSTNLISGVADSSYKNTQLLPKFRLADGTELIGTAFIKNIQSGKEGKNWVVRYHQDELTRVGENRTAPVKDARMKLDTVYTLADGAITRTDTYTPVGTLDIERATLEFAAFSEEASVQGSKVNFAAGDVTSFEVSGLPNCVAAATKGDTRYQSPNGPMKTHVRCSLEHFKMDQPMTVQWTIKYH